MYTRVLTVLPNIRPTPTIEDYDIIVPSDEIQMRAISGKIRTDLTEVSKYYCNKCGLQQGDFFSLYRHVFNTPDHSFTCCICEAQMGHTIGDIINHVKEFCGWPKFNALESSLASDILHYAYFCDRCGIGFTTLVSLREHYVSHKVELVRCILCDFKTRSVQSLMFHIKQHFLDNNMELRCQICSLHFNALKPYQLHYFFVHSQLINIPFKCYICSTIIMDNEDIFVWHLQSHSDVLLKKRSLMSKAVVTNPIDKLSITDTSNATCEICAQTFLTEDACKKHKSKVHFLQVSASLRKQCPRCSKWMIANEIYTHLKEHYRRGCQDIYSTYMKVSTLESKLSLPQIPLGKTHQIGTITTAPIMKAKAMPVEATPLNQPIVPTIHNLTSIELDTKNANFGSPGELRAPGATNPLEMTPKTSINQSLISKTLGTEKRNLNSSIAADRLQVIRSQSPLQNTKLSDLLKTVASSKTKLLEKTILKDSKPLNKQCLITNLNSKTTTIDNTAKTGPVDSKRNERAMQDIPQHDIIPLTEQLLLTIHQATQSIKIKPPCKQQLVEEPKAPLNLSEQLETLLNRNRLSNAPPTNTNGSSKKTIAQQPNYLSHNKQTLIREALESYTSVKLTKPALILNSEQPKGEARGESLKLQSDLSLCVKKHFPEDEMSLAEAKTTNPWLTNDVDPTIRPATIRVKHELDLYGESPERVVNDPWGEPISNAVPICIGDQKSSKDTAVVNIMRRISAPESDRNYLALNNPLVFSEAFKTSDPDTINTVPSRGQTNKIQSNISLPKDLVEGISSSESEENYLDANFSSISQLPPKKPSTITRQMDYENSSFKNSNERRQNSPKPEKSYLGVNQGVELREKFEQRRKSSRWAPRFASGERSTNLEKPLPSIYEKHSRQRSPVVKRASKSLPKRSPTRSRQRSVTMKQAPKPPRISRLSPEIEYLDTKLVKREIPSPIALSSSSSDTEMPDVSPASKISQSSTKNSTVASPHKSTFDSTAVAPDTDDLLQIRISPKLYPNFRCPSPILQEPSQLILQRTGWSSSSDEGSTRSRSPSPFTRELICNPTPAIKSTTPQPSQNMSESNLFVKEKQQSPLVHSGFLDPRTRTPSSLGPKENYFMSGSQAAHPKSVSDYNILQNIVKAPLKGPLGSSYSKKELYSPSQTPSPSESPSSSSSSSSTSPSSSESEDNKVRTPKKLKIVTGVSLTSHLPEKNVFSLSTKHIKVQDPLNTASLYAKHNKVKDQLEKVHRKSPNVSGFEFPLLTESKLVESPDISLYSQVRSVRNTSPSLSGIENITNAVKTPNRKRIKVHHKSPSFDDKSILFSNDSTSDSSASSSDNSTILSAREVARKAQRNSPVSKRKKQKRKTSSRILDSPQVHCHSPLNFATNIQKGVSKSPKSGKDGHRSSKRKHRSPSLPRAPPKSRVRSPSPCGFDDFPLFSDLPQ